MPILPFVLAIAAHGLILSVPLAFVGADWSRGVDAPVVLFILVSLSHGLCEGIASRRCGDFSRLRLKRSVADRVLLPATGLSLLAVSWISLATHAQAAAWGFHPAPLWVLAGLAAMIGGIVLRCLAIVTLGAGFVSATPVQSGRNLVRTGIYRRLRHPSETGLVGIALGIPVLLQSAAGLGFAAAVTVPLCIYRVCREETALRAAFGDDYAGYAHGVSRYFP